jgi:RNA polymerase sigma factor (sigma-70 family)
MPPVARANPSLAPEPKAAHDGAAERFAALIGEHAGIVRKIAATYCRDRDDRADVAQEIAAALWQAFARYDVSRPFSTWMYRIALNVAISHVRSVVRRRRAFVPLDEGMQDVAESLADAGSGAALAALQRAIAVLDPMNRALLVLYLDDRSQREIAEVLGISESNVGTRIGRLKDRIRAALG